MKARLIRIGNSRGVRLPKALIEQADLEEEVELEVRKDSIVISRSAALRHGWKEAAERLVVSGEGDLLDPQIETRFDREEWTW